MRTVVERRKATVADCAGCRDERFHGPNGRQCWSFPYAVIVTKLKITDGVTNVCEKDGAFAELLASADRVDVPHCYSQPGYLHLIPIQGESRSEWEGGDAA